LRCASTDSTERGGDDSEVGGVIDGGGWDEFTSPLPSMISKPPPSTAPLVLCPWLELVPTPRYSLQQAASARRQGKAFVVVVLEPVPDAEEALPAEVIP
jgi:hypothetical protein